MTECAMCAAERKIHAHLARLAVPEAEWPTYTTALEQAPGVLALLEQCGTREQLDQLTETGAVP